KEAEWNHFYEYQTISLCIGIASVGSKILPAVDHILSEYLTLQILSIEHIEIAQCLYFDATLANLTSIEFNDDNESMDDRFIEDIYDTKQILLKLIVSKINQVNIKETWQITNKWPENNKRKHYIIVIDSVSYMSSQWYCNSKKETIDQKNVIFANLDTSNAQQDQTIALIPHSFKHAIQLAVEYDDDEIDQWLKTFINQKK
ncbi:980_t:CDS:2, partial [Dentiscutata erythropus]